MGILAHVFVAPADQALRYEQAVVSGSAEQLAHFDRAQYKGLTALEFGTLWAIVEGAEWDIDRHMLTSNAQGEGGETWLDEFPTDFVQALANLETQSISGLCVRWGETEELGCPGEELQPVLVDLVRLARKSLAEGTPMFLWGSL